MTACLTKGTASARWAVVAIVALALVVSACSSDGGGLTVETEQPTSENAPDDAPTDGDSPVQDDESQDDGAAPPPDDGDAGGDDEVIHPKDIDFRRVNFAPGTTGTTVSGTIDPGFVNGYQVAASAGQFMDVSIIAFDGTATFEAYAPDGATLLGSGPVVGFDLPSDGDYLVVVRGSDGAAYDLTINVSASLGIGTCTSGQLATGGQYAVANIPDNDPDGGLVAHSLPGVNEPIRDVLTEGTVVDTFADAASCAVVSDGAVWWEIGTPQLATGGWVHSGFLAPADGGNAAQRNPGGVYGDYGIYERVRFAPGTTGTTVSGGVVTGTVNGYLVGAAAGQSMELILTSDTGGLMDVYAPDDSTLATGTQFFSDELPATGDYLVVVTRTAGNATYDLSIIVQDEFD